MSAKQINPTNRGVICLDRDPPEPSVIIVLQHPIRESNRGMQDRAQLLEAYLYGTADESAHAEDYLRKRRLL